MNKALLMFWIIVLILLAGCKQSEQDYLVSIHLLSPTHDIVTVRENATVKLFVINNDMEIFNGSLEIIYDSDCINSSHFIETYHKTLARDVIKISITPYKYQYAFIFNYVPISKCDGSMIIFQVRNSNNFLKYQEEVFVYAIEKEVKPNSSQD